MPRSGTSALTRLLQAAGLDVGDDLLAAAAANPLGFFEDRTFVDLQREMIAAAVPPDAVAGPRWMSAGRAVPELLVPFEARARELVAARDAAADDRPWGFKDPRTTMFLDFWSRVAPRARFVFVYRPPWEVVDSLARLSARPYAGRFGAVMDAWVDYNAAILRFAEREPQRCVIVHVDAVAQSPQAVVELAARLLGDDSGLTVPPSATFVPSLMRRIPSSDVRAELVAGGWPAATELYARMEERADLPAASSAAADVPVVVGTPGGGEVAIDVVAVGRPADAHEGGLAVEVGSVPSPSAAARSGVTATTAPHVAVLLDGRLRPGALHAAALAFAEHPSIEAVLLLADGPDGPAAPLAPGPVDAAALARATRQVPGIVVSRAAWQRIGGFDEELTGAGLDAWALAVAVLADGGALRQIDAAVLDAAGLSAVEERGAVRRTVAARHGELYATMLLPASDALAGELLDRTTEIGELQERLAEAAAQRDELADRWRTAADARDAACAALARVQDGDATSATPGDAREHRPRRRWTRRT